jgi:FtsZ-binding cell division protein ZapB
MQKLFSKADNIELKIKQILSKVELLKKENDFLKEENKNLVEKLKQQKGIIKELEIKTNHIEEGDERLSDASREGLRNNIDAQITELDQVIDILRRT